MFYSKDLCIALQPHTHACIHASLSDVYILGMRYYRALSLGSQGWVVVVFWLDHTGLYISSGSRNSLVDLCPKGTYWITAD